MSTTMNGYARIDTIDDRLTLATVSGHSTRLLGGPVATVLCEVGRRFHTDVEPVTTFNGWRSAALNKSSGGITSSNHLSGTAVDVNGGKHPRFEHGTFTDAQVSAIRQILVDLGGVVRWGGDWNGEGRLTEGDADEMHFEVVSNIATLTPVANRIADPLHPDGVPLNNLTAHLEDDMVTDIIELYTRILGRGPSTDDICARLVQTPTQVVDDLLNASPTNEPSSVDAAYRDYLNRAPDPTGRATWGAQPTIRAMRAGLKASAADGAT